MSIETVLLAGILAVVCAAFSAQLATAKHRDPAGFALVGLLFGPLGVLNVIFAWHGDDPDFQARHAAREQRRLAKLPQPFVPVRHQPLRHRSSTSPRGRSRCTTEPPPFSR
jgi:hypothetical protein